MKLLVAGKLLIIFDGFDEMANVADIKSRVEHFRSLWQFSYPKTKNYYLPGDVIFFWVNKISKTPLVWVNIKVKNNIVKHFTWLLLRTIR
jgi:hypothetical protein